MQEVQKDMISINTASILGWKLSKFCLSVQNQPCWVSALNTASTFLLFLLSLPNSGMGKEKLSFKEVHHSHSPKTTLWWFFLVATCIKVLLFPSYRSTDFEVHRNWLALTHSLPLSQWYFDETSPWTLDYPPFFAYFERFLSIFAHLIDPQIVHLQNGLNYSSNKVVYFQRVTVILSDLSLLYGVYRLTRNLDSRKQQLIWSLVIWSPMLFIVDHVHFQYNGFLIGILLISLSYLEEGRDLLGGFVFAVLLCFKHLFAVAAPVYFVYLLRHYCWGGTVRGIGRLLIMGGVVTAVFASAFGPFFHLGQVNIIFVSWIHIWSSFLPYVMLFSPCFW